LAVASLADTACIILAEGVTLEKEVELAAEAKGVNVLASDKPAYEIAAALSKLLS
jgi:serine kinase of HPr protein (carbohydrate metabolism regulator)